MDVIAYLRFMIIVVDMYIVLRHLIRITIYFLYAYRQYILYASYSP